MQSRFMLEAIKEAKEALSCGEIPVGCVIVKENKIIARGRNERECKNLATSHAEIEAINRACDTLGAWRLDGCEIYVTLEPCMMCMGAIVASRIKTLVFGAYDLECGCADSKISGKTVLSSKTPEIFGGIMEDECKNLLKSFFNTVRNDEGRK